MASDGKTHIFRAKTFTEALNKAKNKFGTDFHIVARRDVKEAAGLFSKLTRGKLEAPEVLLEVAPGDADEKPAKGKPTAPNPLLRSYTKAKEGVEKHNAQARHLMAEAARPFAEVGASASGISNQLAEVKNALEKSGRESVSFRNDILELLSIQARSGLPSVGPRLLDYFRRLSAIDIEDSLARGIVEEIQREKPGLDDARKLFEEIHRQVARRFPFAGPFLPRATGPVVIALVGPSGVGKSTALAKLAIDYTVRLKKSVGLVNEDMRRPGAEQQMSNLAKLISVPIVSASEPKEVANAVKSMASRDLVLVDTAGRSPTEPEGIEKLGEILSAADVSECHLALAAVCSLKMLRESVRRFKPCGYSRIILTKLDETVARGELLNFAAGLSDGLSYVTDGADYMKPIRSADCEWLADLVLEDLRKGDVATEGAAT